MLTLMMRAAPSARLAPILGACFVILLSCFVYPVYAQDVPGSIVRESGGLTFSLTLPHAGLHAGGTVTFSLHIAQQDIAARPLPAVEMAISVGLTMPSMTGMTMAQPEAASSGSPGDYRVTALLPHAGDYQLTAIVRSASDGKQLAKATFPLHAATGEGAGAAMMMMPSVAGISSSQQASGTSWQPAITPMYGIHKMLGEWMVMTHYNVSLNYDRQEGSRGDYQYNSTNWLMVMADRKLGQDELQLRTMLTLEPLTVTAGGYPLLFQSGEQYHGRPLVDRQHPHDMFMEVAGRYTHPTSGDGAVFLYAAPSGEPALGPTAFMHRLSALDIPAAPITHHWMDSTHIDFGVLTVGAWKRNFQLETSYFTGREPDEYRYDFGPMHMDSFSGRLSYNPGPNWSAQVSYGYIHSPEALRPGEDIRRTTVSASYTLPRSRGGWWAATVGLGNNSSDGMNSSAVLVESELNLADRNTFFGRFEFVNKLGEELNILPASQAFALGELTLGYVRDVTPNRSYQTGIGAAITFNAHASNLNALYGASPMGFWLFVRVRPAPMHHKM